MDFLELQAELDRDEVQDWEKEIMIGVLDGMEAEADLTPLEQLRYHLVRERVMRAMDAGYPSGRGHAAA